MRGNIHALEGILGWAYEKLTTEEVNNK